MFSTRQNPDDIGKDADFLGINFKNQGSDDMRIYGAVIGRGHDSVSKHHEKYFCFQNLTFTITSHNAHR